MTREAPFAVESGFSCCEPYVNISKMEWPMTIVVWSDPNILHAAIWIILTPIIWMMVARIEHKTRSFRRIFGCPFRACYCLSAFIIVTSFYRNICFRDAVLSQRKWWFFRQNTILWIGHLLVILGTMLVASSLRTLGYLRTFLGDYFGILQEEVTSFPYNLYRHPLYVGSSLIFVGYSLVSASQAGLLLSLLVVFMYHVDIVMERSFKDRNGKNNIENLSETSERLKLN